MNPHCFAHMHPNFPPQGPKSHTYCYYTYLDKDTNDLQSGHNAVQVLLRCSAGYHISLGHFKLEVAVTVHLHIMFYKQRF